MASDSEDVEEVIMIIYYAMVFLHKHPLIKKIIIDLPR